MEASTNIIFFDSCLPLQIIITCISDCEPDIRFSKEWLILVKNKGIDQFFSGKFFTLCSNVQNLHRNVQFVSRLTNGSKCVILQGYVVRKLYINIAENKIFEKKNPNCNMQGARDMQYTISRRGTCAGCNPWLAKTTVHN